MDIDITSIIIGFGGGGLVGVFFGTILTKGKITSLEDRISGIEDERDAVKKKLDAGSKELDKAKKKAGELDDALSKSKKSLKDAESAKKKHLDQAKELEKKASQIEDQAKAAESKAREVESKAKELEREAAEKSAQVSQLEEDLKAAGSGKAAKFDDVQGDLDGILKVLCEHEQQEAAVIADANGIVVAAFGDVGVKEGMAAAANRITKIGDQLTGMVEFSTVSTFRISDAGHKVISGRTFDVAGEMLALATVGATMPSDRSLDGAMQSLSDTLG